MCFRCGHCLVHWLQSNASMLPVTLFAVNAVIFVLKLPFILNSSISMGLVSNVSTCPFKTITVTFSVVPCTPNSAATSALMYVLVLASSSRAFTFTDRLPFVSMTGTVRRAI